MFRKDKIRFCSPSSTNEVSLDAHSLDASNGTVGLGWGDHSGGLGV